MTTKKTELLPNDAIRWQNKQLVEVRQASRLFGQWYLPPIGEAYTQAPSVQRKLAFESRNLRAIQRQFKMSNPAMPIREAKPIGAELFGAEQRERVQTKDGQAYWLDAYGNLEPDNGEAFDGELYDTKGDSLYGSRLTERKLGDSRNGESSAFILKTLERSFSASKAEREKLLSNARILRVQGKFSQTDESKLRSRLGSIWQGLLATRRAIRKAERGIMAGSRAANFIRFGHFERKTQTWVEPKEVSDTSVLDAIACACACTITENCNGLFPSRKEGEKRQAPPWYRQAFRSACGAIRSQGKAVKGDRAEQVLVITGMDLEPIAGSIEPDVYREESKQDLTQAKQAIRKTMLRIGYYGLDGLTGKQRQKDTVKRDKLRLLWRILSSGESLVQFFSHRLAIDRFLQSIGLDLTSGELGITMQAIGGEADLGQQMGAMREARQNPIQRKRRTKGELERQAERIASYRKRIAHRAGLNGLPIVRR